MTYSEWHQIFVAKVKSYDFYTCRRAMFDCYDTLDLWKEKISADYATKLWAEIDALRERQAKL